MPLELDLVFTAILVAAGVGFALSVLLLLVARLAGHGARPAGILMGVSAALYVLGGVAGAAARVEIMAAKTISSAADPPLVVSELARTAVDAAVPVEPEPSAEPEGAPEVGLVAKADPEPGDPSGSEGAPGIGSAPAVPSEADVIVEVEEEEEPAVAAASVVGVSAVELAEIDRRLRAARARKREREAEAAARPPAPPIDDAPTSTVVPLATPEQPPKTPETASKPEAAKPEPPKAPDVPKPEVAEGSKVPDPPDPDAAAKPEPPDPLEVEKPDASPPSKDLAPTKKPDPPSSADLLPDLE